MFQQFFLLMFFSYFSSVFPPFDFELNLFRGLALFSLGSTVLSAILIIVQLALTDGSEPTHGEFSFDGLCLAFGTILFSFGGATQFPSIQNDMKQRDKFPIAVFAAFTSEYK